MERARTTPKDFFLWVGAMVSLYWSVVALIFLLFDYINYALPNPLNTYQGDPYQSSIPYDMASITVLLPLGIFLMWLIRRDIVRDESRGEIWVRRWLLIFTLFVAGITAAIDLVILLTTFFRGEELTLTFVLKIVIVLLVAALAFMHFIADLWGYWAQYPARARSVGLGVVILAAVAIVSGFFIVGTPNTARLMRLDDQKVSNLQTIQYQIVNYWQHKQSLPKSIADLNDPLSGIQVPIDEQTGQQYEYRATGAKSFELCATFNKDNYGRRSTITVPEPMGLAGPGASENWQHAAGRVCFSRTIDPQLYPPIKSVPAQ